MHAIFAETAQVPLTAIAFSIRGSRQFAGSSAGSGALQPVASSATDADAALPEPRADAGSLLDAENSGAEEASAADSGDAANDAAMQELNSDNDAHR